METSIRTRIIVTQHAQQRLQERGGDRTQIVTIAKQEAPRIISTAIQSRVPRVALEIPDSGVIPVIEVSPRRYGVGLIVITVLPEPARLFHPIVTV